MMRVKAKLLGLICINMLLFSSLSVQASEAEESSGKKFVNKVKQVIQSIEVYRVPVASQPRKEDLAKSCRDLEYELAALQSMTYSYQPDFYNDPVQGTAFWVGTTVFWPAYGALGYTAYYDYQENERIYKAQDRIETLRRAKAEKRCFES